MIVLEHVPFVGVTWAVKCDGFRRRCPARVVGFRTFAGAVERADDLGWEFGFESWTARIFCVCPACRQERDRTGSLPADSQAVQAPGPIDTVGPS